MRCSIARIAMQFARTYNLAKLALDADDTFVDLAPIRFDLRLAWPADGAQATALSLKMSPASDEARSLIG